MNIGSLVSELRKEMKDEFFNDLIKSLDKNDENELLINKEKELKEKVKELIQYINNENTRIFNKFDDFNKSFRLNRIHTDKDAIIVFQSLSDFENELLSSYMRNNSHNKNVKKLGTIIEKMIKKILKNAGALPKNLRTKDLQMLVEDNELYQLYKDLEDGFIVFFKNYEQLVYKIKDKGYNLRNYIEVMKFNHGNI
jgi:hypothetical protein